MEDKKKKAYELWKKAGGENAPHGTLKSISIELKISDGTMRTWKRSWTNSKNVSKNVLPHKKAKEMAKALIEEGYSISEVSRQTETPRSTVGKWSAEGNLQQSQLEYLKSFREKHREKIRLNKEKRLQVNETALEAIEYEIGHWEDNGRISKAAMEKLLMNEEAEQKILELDRIEKLEKLQMDREKLEFEKEKVKDSEDKEEKVISGLEALQEAINARRKV